MIPRPRDSAIGILDRREVRCARLMRREAGSIAAKAVGYNAAWGGFSQWSAWYWSGAAMTEVRVCAMVRGRSPYE